MALRRAIYIVAPKRTAFGTYGGALKNLSPTDLQEMTGRATLEEGNIASEMVDSVVVGNVIQAARDSAYCHRHVSLRLGLRHEIQCLQLNRMCGSGFQAIISAAHDIQLGESEVVLVGGTESMSGAPLNVYGGRFGVRLGIELQLEDAMFGLQVDRQINQSMPDTAENLAEKYDINREQCDEYAFKSHQRWKQASDDGRFKDEIVPVPIPSKNGDSIFETDEHPRPDISLDAMSKLPAIFKDGGTVTAANACGICDGAASLVLASEEAVKNHGLTPLARLAGYSVVGCDPTIMGYGPVPAIRRLLKKAGKELKDMDLLEVNEAFAAQYLAVEKELGLDPEKTNTNGGAIAMGHPLAASGVRITGHLAHELKRTGGKHGIGSVCIGGGQGIAVMLESV